MFNSIAVVNYWILQSAAPVLVILKRPVNLELFQEEICKLVMNFLRLYHLVNYVQL